MLLPVTATRWNVGLGRLCPGIGLALALALGLSLAVAGGDLSPDGGFLSSAARLLARRTLVNAAQSFLLPLLGRSFAHISSPFPLVSELLALIGNPIAFVRCAIPLLRCAIALVSKPLAANYRPLPDIEPIEQPAALVLQVHVGGSELRRPLSDLRTASLDLGASSLIALLQPVGAQTLQIRAVGLKPRRRTFELGAAPLELCPLRLSARRPPRSRRFVALRTALMRERRLLLGHSRVRHHPAAPSSLTSVRARAACRPTSALSLAAVSRSTLA